MFFHFTRFAQQTYLLSYADATALHAANADATDIRRIINAGHQHLEAALLHLRCRHMLQNRIEQRQYIVGRRAPVVTHPAIFGRAKKGWEVELLFSGAQIEHQVEYGLLRLVGRTVGLINFIDDHNRPKSQFQRFLQYKTGLWHWALEGVDQQKNAISHIEHPLYFTTKIGVARGVDNVDFMVFVGDRDILGQNSDAALALQVVVVENQLTRQFMLFEKSASQQHFVDQRGFAMIDVCDDGNVANIIHAKNYCR